MSLEAAGITAIYSSDLLRARQTAQVLAEACGLPVHLDSRLREIHQGEWQGMLFSEIEARYAQAYQDQKQDPLSFASSRWGDSCRCSPAYCVRRAGYHPPASRRYRRCGFAWLCPGDLDRSPER